ncbi:DUF2924 domain-containing protein [Aquisediminimonas profunda]|uniref:DUF2924 domain-containing protein n=1 Tax=Aquisediminimonas profunda TaxID=1550733 RepID=UPI001C628CDB|nr:DUF2924 domain-containing protein [Aquisediminimonas profunda]
MNMVPLDQQIDRLATLSAAELRAEWRRVYRAPSPHLTTDLLVRGIAWQLQVKMPGGLSRLAERTLDQRAGLGPQKRALDPSRLKPGTRLVRRWQDVTYDVLVTEDGYLFKEKFFGSLSAIAEAITGTRWSGPRFFGLADRGRTGHGRKR